jgi:geranylgeranyl diphosphate synthase type I
MEEKFRRIIDERWALVKPVMSDILKQNSSDKVKDIVSIQMNQQGKRLRPTFTILACEGVGGDKKDAIYPAATIEIIHNASLIIDDIIDGQQYRRKKITLWKQCGKDITQCIAVNYFSGIMQAIIKSKMPIEINDVLANTIKKMVDGEIKDISFNQSKKFDISEEKYLNMIKNKTATLFQSSFEVGSMCGNSSELLTKKLKKYGFYYGLCFQIIDDILDIMGRNGLIGKDIIQKKAGNILLLYAFQELPENKKEDIKKIFNKKDIRTTDIELVINTIKETKALNKAYELAEKYKNESKKSIKDLDNFQIKDILYFMADYSFKRAY